MYEANEYSRTVIYGTIAMDSDRDKRVYKILIVFLVREGYLMLYEDLETLFQTARKKIEADGNI